MIESWEDEGGYVPVEEMAGEFRVLVCGNRDYPHRYLLWATLDGLHMKRRITTLIEGEAMGADTQARQWARGTDDDWETKPQTWPHPEVELLRYPAEWDKHGRPAGPIRNKKMLVEGKPDLVLAFTAVPLTKSSGTANMVKIAKAAGVKTVVYGQHQEY